MMEDRLFESKGRVAVHMAARKVLVPPGGSVSVPLVLLNGGAQADFFKLSVQGIPPNWVSLPSPVVRIREGEQRDVALVVQPPDSSQIGAGRYPLIIRVTSHSAPEDVVALEGTLVVAALEVEGRVGLLMASNTVSAVPGESSTVPVVLLNQGLEADTLQLAVDGIPGYWVSQSPGMIPLSPGQQKEVSIAIRPPPGTESRAGRHRFRIQVISQANPDDFIEAECVLTVATYAAFSAVLDPLRTEAGEPARISIENRGNYQQTFGLMWRSLNDELAFETSATRPLRIPAGQSESVELKATPRRRPLIGGGMSHAFTVRVRSADQEVQDLRGEVISKARFPTWVVVVLLVLGLALVTLSVSILAGLGASEPAVPLSTPEGDAVAPADGVLSEPTAESPEGQQAGSHADEPGGEEAFPRLLALPCMPVGLGQVPSLVASVRRQTWPCSERCETATPVLGT